MGLCSLRLNCKKCGGAGWGSGDGLFLTSLVKKLQLEVIWSGKSNILNRLKTKELEHIKHTGDFEWWSVEF